MAKTYSTTDLLRPRLLRVPDFQRGYAWEREQVQDFLDDLAWLEQGQQHYTGTVVLLNSGEPLVDDESNALLRADIVDGQQRVTTICLLLNELRLAFAAAGHPQIADGLRRQFLLVTKDGVRLPKLELTSDSRPMWESLLNDEPLGDAENLSSLRLREAARHLRRHVEALADKEGPSIARLTALRDQVMGALRFTTYELDHQAEVGVIFETLNDRGKPLTELEKAKNYLLFLASRLPEGPQVMLAAKINEAWSTVYRLLLEVARVSPAGEDQFLRAHWLAAVDPAARSWRGTKSLKNRFSRDRYLGEHDLLIREVGNYVDGLARAARFFADSLRFDAQAFPSFGDQAPRARTLHEQLRRAGTVAVFQPLMIALRHRLPDDGEAYNRILDLCLRFAVRAYLIGGYRADAGQVRLYRLAHECYVGSRDVPSLDRALRRLVADYADDAYVQGRLRNTDGNWYRWGGITFFLYEYELHLLSGAEPDVGYAYFEEAKKQKTVEHILPQTPTAYWRQRFSSEEQRRYTHALGNLVLTYDNSAYSNKDFPAKRGQAGPGQPERACYAQGKLEQERRLASLEDWTPEEVERRQRRLATWALQHWAVDVSDLEFEAHEVADDEEQLEEEVVGDGAEPLTLEV